VFASDHSLTRMRVCLPIYFPSISTDIMTFSVEVSYLEIYNEQVFDLLGKSQVNLKARTQSAITCGYALN
jgi:hypothetical protein